MHNLFDVVKVFVNVCCLMGEDGVNFPLFFPPHFCYVLGFTIMLIKLRTEYITVKPV